MEPALFSDFLNEYKNKKLAICTHIQPDADSLVSAFAVSSVLKNSVICVPDFPSDKWMNLVEKLGFEIRILKNLNKSDFDGLVVVDTSTFVLLPDAKGWDIKLIIDHHRSEGRDMESPYKIIDSDSPSCAEIIADILPEINESVAFGLAVGVIADGARFKSARKNTFSTLAKMMDICKSDYSDLLSYAEPELSVEEKLALIKAMQRVEFVTSGTWLIVTSEVGAHEGDASSLLAEIADVAFVASWKPAEKECRISSRAGNKFPVPLNEVMNEVGKSLGGDGGGHAKAAGAVAKCHTEEALKKCVEVVMSKL